MLLNGKEKKRNLNTLTFTNICDFCLEKFYAIANQIQTSISFLNVMWRLKPFSYRLRVKWQVQYQADGRRKEKKITPFCCYTIMGMILDPEQKQIKTWHFYVAQVPSFSPMFTQTKRRKNVNKPLSKSENWFLRRSLKSHSSHLFSYSKSVPSGIHLWICCF